ncbi:uncharacterized protein C8R40DRAFT_1165694 [Lentinula edodes]|uniref:uncharacterized protein n=1 Tax=Lentinula edodes TaxID=5353 RepID=UPI001E8D04CE|nr:uncharacterized protein C8R40DRAFT_1165694 [Lentinula edodes]KAH7880761.1 hypothetical protein C8R40DRAFT_1165694 [Lentinula edodes]
MHVTFVPGIKFGRRNPTIHGNSGTALRMQKLAGSFIIDNFQITEKEISWKNAYSNEQDLEHVRFRLENVVGGIRSFAIAIVDAQSPGSGDAVHVEVTKFILDPENPQSGRHLPNTEFLVSPRRVAQQPSLLQDSSPGDSYFPSATSGRHPNNDRPNIQTPTNQSTLIRSRFQLIFHPVPGGDLDDPSTFENTKRMVDIITRYLNQGVHYHQLSPSDFTLVNGWVADGNGSSPVVEFRTEDSNRRGHCNPFCLGMIDVPYDAGDESENPDTTRIHGTLAQDRWQLHLDHAVSRTLS